MTLALSGSAPTITRSERKPGQLVVTGTRFLHAYSSRRPEQQRELRVLAPQQRLRLRQQGKGGVCAVCRHEVAFSSSKKVSGNPPNVHPWQEARHGRRAVKRAERRSTKDKSPPKPPSPLPVCRSRFPRTTSTDLSGLAEPCRI